MLSRAAGLHPLRPTRWCALISGRGSNLAALLEKPDSNVHLVMTTDLDAAGVPKARRAGITVVEVPRRVSPEGTGKIDWAKLDEELEARSIDAVFLLGFMRIVPASFISRWEGRILNLHPSLLPAFPGLKSIERAVLDGAACGPTIHEVVVEVDAGPLLASRVSRVAGAAPMKIESVETLVHIDEQRLVKEIVEKWRPKKQS